MYTNLKRVYHPDHDERYAHIPEDQRKEYPDEIIDGDTGKVIVKRQYTMNELRRMNPVRRLTEAFGEYAYEVIGQFDSYIYAKDVPLSEVFKHEKDIRERKERVRAAAAA